MGRVKVNTTGQSHDGYEQSEVQLEKCRKFESLPLSGLYCVVYVATRYPRSKKVDQLWGKRKTLDQKKQNRNSS